MVSQEVIDRYNITCPDKGSFFICDDKPQRFIGCCTVDPCKTSDGVCPDDSLTAASFNIYSYKQMKAQSCVSDRPEVQWYSCAHSTPPFMGCCQRNPCDAGCKKSDLFAAVLSPDEENADAFLPEGYSHTQGLSTGAKAGIAVGCVVAGLVIIGLAAWWFLRRRKQKQEQQPQAVVVGEKNSKNHRNHTSQMSNFYDPSPTVGHVPSSRNDMDAPGPLRSTVYDPYGGEHVIGSPATVSALTSPRSTMISGYEPSAPSISPYEGYPSSQPIPPMPSPSPNQWHPSMYNSNRHSQGEAYPYALNAISPMPTGHESAYYSPQQFDQTYLQPMPGVPMPQPRQQHVAELPAMMEGSEGVAEAPNAQAPSGSRRGGRKGRT